MDGDNLVALLPFLEQMTKLHIRLQRIMSNPESTEQLFWSASLKVIMAICVSFSLSVLRHCHLIWVSLPGGEAEEGDKDHCDTAKREANEEIGLDPSLVDIVTVLEPFFAKVWVNMPALTMGVDIFGDISCLQNLLRVFPVIGILSDRKSFTPVPNAAEVEAVFDAPLEMFIKDENRRSEVRDMHGRGNQIVIHYFDYVTDNKRYMIWGLTAAVLIRAASVIYQRRPNFLE